MNCENCGAPLQPVADRGYLFCAYCGSFRFPAANSEGVQLLSLGPESLQCPVCRQEMPLASLDGWEVLSCPRCRGVLLPQLTFRELISARRARAAGPARPPRPLDAAELRRRLGCPSCERTMSTHPYYGPGNIVIDTCADCGLLWLDFGELSRVVDAPGRDRGDYRLSLMDLLEDDEDEDD